MLQSVPAQIAAMYLSAHRSDDPCTPKLEPADFMTFGGKEKPPEVKPPDTGMNAQELMQLFNFRMAQKKLKLMAAKQQDGNG